MAMMSLKCTVFNFHKLPPLELLVYQCYHNLLSEYRDDTISSNGPFRPLFASEHRVADNLW